MALTLGLNVTTEDCKNLIFTETTGAYNVTTNPTGWGTPNPTIASASLATVSVTVPNGTVYTFSVAGSSFPTTTITQQYVIPYTSLGMTSSSGLVDGLYSILYSLSVTPGVIYLQLQKTMIVCNLECCIDKMLLDLDLSCECSEDAKENYLTAHAIFEQIQHSIECGDLDTAEELVDMANKLCKNSNCSTCK